MFVVSTRRNKFHGIGTSRRGARQRSRYEDRNSYLYNDNNIVYTTLRRRVTNVDLLIYMYTAIYETDVLSSLLLLLLCTAAAVWS
jgi:hypothetical protein